MHSKFHYDSKGEKPLKLGAKNDTVKNRNHEVQTDHDIKILLLNILNFGKKLISVRGINVTEQLQQIY